MLPPLLLERLKEYTPDDQSRRKWLTLNMAEIELAVAQGRVEVKRGGRSRGAADLFSR